MTLGQRIMQIRMTAGLSQEEFGAKLGTSRQTVSKWELDIAIPEIARIVSISRLFSVTTDSILVDGISTFDEEHEQFSCGIYKSDNMEIVETERIALLFSSDLEKKKFSAKAYVGFDDKKELKAICEYNSENKETLYAYVTDTGIVLSNSKEQESNLGNKYNTSLKKTLYRTEHFFVSNKNKLPTVGEAGIKNCLNAWRISSTLNATAEKFNIQICTDKTEYIFNIAPKDVNIYCGISYNLVSELGLYVGSQFFRIRNYKDNSEKFCTSHCDLGHMPIYFPDLGEECVSGRCVNTKEGLFFGIKRYTDDEIILCGCGDDEYRYSRLDKKLEIFSLI